MKTRFAVEFDISDKMDLHAYPHIDNFEDAAKMDLQNILDNPEFLLDYIKVIKIKLIDENEKVVNVFGEDDINV